MAMTSVDSLAEPRITPPPALPALPPWNSGARLSIDAIQSSTTNSSSVTAGAALQLKAGFVVMLAYMSARMPSYVAFEGK